MLLAARNKKHAFLRAWQLPAFALLLASVASAKTIAADTQDQPTVRNLDALRWHYRVILVKAESKTSSQQSLARLQSQKAEVEERHILWFIQDESLIHSNAEVDEKLLRDELATYFSEKKSTEILLIGKDGGVKMRRTHLDLAEIFRRIDSMPMRMQEMSRQKRKDFDPSRKPGK